MRRCEYLNQAHYNLDNVKVGNQCQEEGRFVEANPGLTLSSRIYRFCRVHSYTADRKENCLSENQ